MANTYYCSQCGFPTSYTLTKPSFCGGCGKSLSNASFASAAPQKSVTPTHHVIDHPRQRTIEVYDDEPEEYIPDVDKLTFQIEGAEIAKPQTLESLMFNNPVKPQPRESGRGRGRPPKPKRDPNAFQNIMARAKSGTRGNDLE